MTTHPALNRDYFVSVVAVLEDDAAIVEAFVAETAAVLKARYENYEIVLIDNDSVDTTAAVMQRVLTREDCIRFVKLSRRYPLESALSAGLDTAIGDVVVTLEPHCDPPALIPSFVDRTIATSGVVYGIRENYDERMSWSYRVGKQVFHVLCHLLFEFSPPRSAGFFMGLSRSALNAIVQFRGKSKFLRVFGRRIGYPTDAMPYAIQVRGQMKRRSFIESLDYGVAVIFTNSNRPLRLISILGLTAAALNLAYIAGVLVTALTSSGGANAMTGIAVLIATMFLFLFLMGALLCEHYIRNADNATDAPTYYIEREETSSVMVVNEDQRRNVFLGDREAGT